LTLPKIALVLSILFASAPLHSQSWELIGGANENLFFDFKQNEEQINSEYFGRRGYVFRIAYETKSFSRTTMRYTLSYDKFGGSVKVSDVNYWSGQRTEAEVSKSTISLGLFPLNLLLFEDLIINLGVEVSSLIFCSTDGMTVEWNRSGNKTVYDLNEIHFNSDIYIGIRGRITYDIPVSERLAITPQYSFYWGISNEFAEFPDFAKSMRHYISIGIKAYIRPNIIVY